MKRNQKIFLFIILMIILNPIIVNGYGITNYIINSTIKSNGDLEVEEYFELDGSFNGFERIINYKNSNLNDFNSTLNNYGGSSIHNGDKIIVEQVSSVDFDSNYDFSIKPSNFFKEVDYSPESGTSNVYKKTDNIDGVTLRIYLPSKKNKAFYIKYTIKNMAVLHNDIGELYWNIVGNSLSEYVDYLKAYINLPNNTSIKAWAHGPLNGKVNIISNDKIEVSIEDLNRYTAIDVRTTFDKNIILDSSKKTNVDALEKILNYEQIEANKANEERERINDSIKTDALNAILNLEAVPSRTYYLNAIEYTNRIGDENLKLEYLNRIKLQEKNIEPYHFKIASDYLNLAIKTKNFTYYKYAKESINDVQDQNNLNILNKKLSQAKKVIMIKESKSEMIIVLLNVVAIILMNFLLKLKFFNRLNKEPKYLRELPSNLHPSSVGYLYNKKATSNQITANLLSLIDEGVITYEKVEENNYLFTLVEEKNKDLSDIDKTFISLFFNKKPKITSKEFNKNSKDDIIKNRYLLYSKKIKNNLEDNNLIEKDDDKEKIINFELISIAIIASLVNIKSMIITIPVILLYLILKNGVKISTFSMFLFIITIILNIYTTYYSFTINNINHISVIFNVFTMILSASLMKKCLINTIIRTKEGKEENNNWIRFKNFLSDFSLFNEKELPEVSLWEKYLVYGTALGCAKELSNVMSQKLSLISDNTSSLVLFSNMDDFMIFNNSISNSMSSINYSKNNLPIRLESNILNSSGSSSWSSSDSWSSGGGSGGGFSGGSSSGGGGGGGGGGGRF